MSKTLASIMLIVSLSCVAQSQEQFTGRGTAVDLIQQYQIHFESAETVLPVPAAATISMPVECTSDDTVFMNSLLRTSQTAPPIEALLSVSRVDGAREFRLDQLTDLYDVEQKGYFTTESNVFLLIIAATENKQGKEMVIMSDGTKHEITRNLADHHDFIVIFDRKGTYQKRIQIDDTIAVMRIGVFRSGSFLAFGFDRSNRSPKLAILKDDGTLATFVDIPKSDAPALMFGTKHVIGGQSVFIKPVHIVAYGSSLIVVQNESKFPLLAVEDGGAIKPIQAKLPEGVKVERLVPSDDALFARVSGPCEHAIYELNTETGTPIKRFRDEGNASDGGVACIKDEKFLAFYQNEGKLISRIGAAEPFPNGSVKDDPKCQESPK